MNDRPFNPKPKIGMNAHEVKFALHKMFSADDGWLAVEELFIPGFDRYIDLWAMRVDTVHNVSIKHSDKFMHVHAIEVKVSRSDFTAEIKTPAKRLAAQHFSNYFSFATPRGIIEPEELPTGIGLIEFSGSKGKWMRNPVFTNLEPVRWDLVAAIGRAILKSI